MSGPAAQRRSSYERERLIAAFVLLCNARGYAEVDPVEVCRRARVPDDAFSRHFADHFACFEASWESLETIYLQRLADSYNGIEGWREQLRAAIAETLRLIETHPAAARFMTIEAFGAGEGERVHQRALAARLLALLEAATEAADGDEMSAEPAPRWILAMVFDRIYRHLLAGTEERLSDQLPELMFLVVTPSLGTEAGLSELRPPTG